MTGTPRGDLRAVVAELGQLLETLGEQLAATVQEAERECRGIGVAFRRVAAANRRNAAIPLKGKAAERLQDNCRQIDAAVDDAIVAMQYQDLLAQRIFHIRAGLDQIQQHLRDGAERSHEEWLELLRRVERLHRHEQQRLRRAQPLVESTVELF